MTTVDQRDAEIAELRAAREPGPQPRCPKCGAVPLAVAYDRLLCGPCNAWYSCRPMVLPDGSDCPATGGGCFGSCCAEDNGNE